MLTDIAIIILAAMLGNVVFNTFRLPGILGMIGVGLLILAVGLTLRSCGVWLSLLGSALNLKERLFCAIAYLPKATVQAAMGAVPLTMVSDGKMTAMTVESGQVILAMAVLSIMVTAPLGAIGIKLAGPRLLEHE